MFRRLINFFSGYSGGVGGPAQRPRRVRREFGWYEVPDQLWKTVCKLIYIALALFAFWFVRECWLSWNIFS